MCYFIMIFSFSMLLIYIKLIFRTEPKSQSHLGVPGGNTSSRPITPVENKRSPTHGRATGRTKVTSGKKREPSVQLHPKQYSPLRVSPYHGKSPPSTSTNRYLSTF